jgi:hypothetical protein
MMRLRRASAIVALCLLASAATAYAECAWILWQERPALSKQFDLDNYRPGCFGYSASVRQWPKTRTKLRRCRATNNRVAARSLALPPRHRGPARAEREVTVTRSQREASERRGGHRASESSRPTHPGGRSCVRRLRDDRYLLGQAGTDPGDEGRHVPFAVNDELDLAV